MIKVKVCCDCIDIPLEPGTREMNLEFVLEDGATVDDIMKECAGFMPLTYEELVLGRIFVRSNTLIYLDTPLADGDRILMLKAMAGG